MATDQYPGDYTPEGASAAAAIGRAARLRRAAAALRARASRTRGSSRACEGPGGGADLPSLLDDVDQMLRAIQKGAHERALGEETARALHAGIEQAAQSTQAAVAAQREMLLSPDRGTTDAPYGHGAPLHLHPGAICSIIAERAEALAAAIEAAAIAKANATSVP